MKSRARELRRSGWTLLLVSALLASPALSTPDRLSLRLLDASGSPVAGARLLIPGARRVVVTDERGEFRLQREPVSPIRVTVFDRHGAWLGVVTIGSSSGTSSRDVRLSAAAAESVTVRGGTAVATRASPAAAVTVVSALEIEQTLPAHLADALKDVPEGAALEAGHSAVPSLRGLARGRTLLLLDDARVTTERRAGASAGYLDPAGVEGIEIVRGPGSVAYGSDALGGVVHAKTPVPRLGAFGGRALLSGGTGDESLSGLLEGNVPLGRGAVLLQAHARRFDDYESPRGTVENSAARDGGFLARALLPMGGARWTLAAQFDRARDIGRPATDTGVTRTSYPREDSSRFTLGIDAPGVAGFDDVGLRAFFGTHRLITRRDRLPTPAASRTLVESDVDAKDAALRVVARRPLGRGFLRVGADANGRFGLAAREATVAFDSSGRETARIEQTSIDSARRLDTAVFLEAEQTAVPGRLELAAGLRADYLAVRNEGGFFGRRSISHGAVSGYAAATLLPGDGWSLTLQYARGFRDPSLSDRFFRGVTGRGFVTGNPGLDPETSDQYDVAFRGFVGSGASVALFGYVYRIRDLVERYRAAEGFAFRNRGLQELRGLELESDLDFGRAWTARVTVSLLRGRVVDDDSPADDIPPANVSLSLRQRVSQRLWWRGRLALVARDDEPGPTEVITPGYGLLDLATGYRLTGNLEAQVILRNATDKSYPASAEENAVPAPGRSAVLSLLATF